MIHLEAGSFPQLCKSKHITTSLSPKKHRGSLGYLNYSWTQSVTHLMLCLCWAKQPPRCHYCHLTPLHFSHVIAAVTVTTESYCFSPEHSILPRKAASYFMSAKCPVIRIQYQNLHNLLPDNTLSSKSLPLTQQKAQMPNL